MVDFNVTKCFFILTLPYLLSPWDVSCILSCEDLLFTKIATTLQYFLIFGKSLNICHWRSAGLLIELIPKTHVVSPIIL